jgi:stage V sporulation protein AE
LALFGHNLAVELFLKFLFAFCLGGGICLLGQILVLKTSFTPARILVCFVTLGVILQAVGAYAVILKYCGAGISVPITGFGGTLAKGAMDGVARDGFYGILAGGLTAAASGVAVAVVSAFLVSLVARSKSK